MGEDKFTILSFVGGGIRGLMSAKILERLWNEWRSVITDTDLIAGCSTGSMILSQIVAGKTPPEIVEFFLSNAVPFYDKPDTDPHRPAYSIDDVYAAQLALHGTARLSEAGRNVLLLSFNAGGIAQQEDGGILVPKPWQPLLYTNMLPEYADTLIAKAATSSGAMPGQLGSLEGNVDGAFVNHDPTLAAIALAVNHGIKLENIVAITIGTGLMQSWIASSTHDWGADQWMNGDVNPFNNTPPFLMNQSTPSPVLDLCLNGTSTELTPMLTQMLLTSERYANINPTLPCFIPENSTSPEAIALLERKGDTADLEHARELLRTYWRGAAMSSTSGGDEGARATA